MELCESCLRAILSEFLKKTENSDFAHTVDEIYKKKTHLTDPEIIPDETVRISTEYKSPC